MYTDTHPKSDGRERPGAAGASTTATGSYVSTYHARPRTNFRLVFFSIEVDSDPMRICNMIICAYAHVMMIAIPIEKNTSLKFVRGRA